MKWNPESWTSDAWTQFLQEHWIVLLAAVVVIFIVMKVVKTVLKWVLAAAILFGVVAYGGYSIDDLSALGSKVEAGTKDAILKAAVNEASKAEYTVQPDGSYVIRTPNLELKGEKGSGKVKISFQGIPAGTWDVEGPIRTLIEQAESKAGAQA
ncbi:hypothetical protein [Cohnella caldifontis]|uniref:hypothetical protein n=1 Tax=Cohnella caldifontis TaxID=3027471 RepID=UPI0023ED7445|nr:hypothetical protein [Cohnella sp. YIM B05605]